MSVKLLAVMRVFFYPRHRHHDVCACRYLDLSWSAITMGAISPGLAYYSLLQYVPYPELCVSCAELELQCEVFRLQPCGTRAKVTVWPTEC